MTADDYIFGDVFAAGIVTLELLTDGLHPFQGSRDILTMHNMEVGDRSTLLTSLIDEKARNLVWAMTQSNPEDRLGMEQARDSPYFQEDGEHIKTVIALNEELIQMDEAQEETKTLKKELEDSFFMLFESDWRKLPFVVPEILSKSRYSSSVACFLRYCRNMLVHCREHQEVLRKYFERSLKEVEVLGVILEHVPRFIVHWLWFAGRFLPDLLASQGAHFPMACVKAYEQQMEVLKEKLGTKKLAQLRQQMAEASEEAFPHLDSMQDAFKRSHQVCQIGARV